jgi:hypothetical protein
MGMSERLPQKKEKVTSCVAAWEMTGIRPTHRTSVSKHFPRIIVMLQQSLLTFSFSQYNYC